jgi:putative hemolysin
MLKRMSTIGLLAALTGCAAPSQVVEINPGVYSLNVGAMGIEGGEAAARNKALAAASAYCAQKGQQLSLDQQSSHGPVEWGSAAGSASVTFHCVTH